ncbi:MAG: hypothetical protein Q8M98_02870 [Candidatus Cloacimonadaceae bacterium]|nr:hypothetical protein [Candidatus Cloacimonadaceae bacterium]
MFRENWKTGQIDRMDFDRVLSAKKYAELQGSAWQILHKHVYELVNEGSFSVLYNVDIPERLSHTFRSM